MSGIRRIYPKEPVTDPSFGGAALLVCRHGSGTQGAPLPNRTRAMAKASGFVEAAGCCLYGKPSLEEAIRELGPRPIFLVPAFLSAGTTMEALHQRLDALSSKFDIILSPPLGAHPGLSRRILVAAREVAVCRGWAPAETALLLVGHGSQINDASGNFMRQLGDSARKGHLFAEVGVAFLSEQPGIETALADLQSPQIVAVGCFAASGRHAARDVPALLSRSDRPVAYSGAVGEAPWCDQLLLEQALQSVESWLRRRSEPLRHAQGV